MSNYASRIPHYVEGKNEEEVRRELLVRATELNQKLEIINIYHNANKGRVIAWYFHDMSLGSLPPVKKTAKINKKKKVNKKKAR